MSYPDRHIVYAVTHAGRGKAKHRVSGALTWGEAQDTWASMDNPRYHQRARMSVRGQAVSHFAVRAADDPAWPARAPQRTVYQRSFAA